MTVIKRYNSGTAQWETIVVGKQGPQGPTGDAPDPTGEAAGLIPVTDGADGYMLDSAPVLAGFGADGVTADKFVSGRYYSTARNAGVTFALAGANTFGVPFFVPVATAFDRIGLQVLTASTAGGIGRLGIYTMVNGNTDALVVDAGTAAIDSTGAKELTIAETLQPGWYVTVFSPSLGVTIRGASFAVNMGNTTLAATGPFGRFTLAVNYSSVALPAIMSMTPLQSDTTLLIGLRAT